MQWRIEAERARAYTLIMPDPAVLLAANSCWNLVNFRAPIIKGLQENGYRVMAAAPEDSAAATLRGMGVEVHGVEVEPRGLTPARDLSLLASYRSLMRRVRPDAFMPFTPKPNIYGSIPAGWLQIPVVNTITGLGSGFIYGRALEQIMTILYRTGLRRSRRVFFHNPDDRDVFIRKRIVSSDRAAVVAGSGVNIDHFAPPPARKSDGPLTFLFIGRMIEDKGALEFIHAAGIVRQSVPAKFRMLGALQDDPKAIAIGAVEPLLAENEIEILEPVEDVRPLIAQADCVVLPSYREGLPRVLLEASAMGKPSVSTNVPGCRRVVDHGVTGFLCEARSAESLAEAMTSIARLTPGERAIMGNEARQKAEREFREELVVEAYLDALRDIGLKSPAR